MARWEFSSEMAAQYTAAHTSASGKTFLSAVAVRFALTISLSPMVNGGFYRDISILASIRASALHYHVRIKNAPMLVFDQVANF